MGPPEHFGIALAIKPSAPKTPLWILLLGLELLAPRINIYHQHRKRKTE